MQADSPNSQDALVERFAHHGLAAIHARLKQVAAANRVPDESYHIGSYRFVPVRDADGREVGTDCHFPSTGRVLRTRVTDLDCWFDGAVYSFLLHCPQDPSRSIAFLSHGGRAESTLAEVDLAGGVPRASFDLRPGLHAIAWDGPDRLYLG